MTDEVPMNRYKVTVIMERLQNVADNINPETGKVEVHNRLTADGAVVKVTPAWEIVASFGADTGVDATSFVQALGPLSDKMSEQFMKVQETAPLVDQDLT